MTAIALRAVFSTLSKIRRGLCGRNDDKKHCAAYRSTDRIQALPCRQKLRHQSNRGKWCRISTQYLLYRKCNDLISLTSYVISRTRRQPFQDSMHARTWRACILDWPCEIFADERFFHQPDNPITAVAKNIAAPRHNADTILPAANRKQTQPHE